MSQTIYLADDEKNIRNLIQAFLSKEGFSVQTFADGESLLEACKRALPDLVILDVMMPGMDGFSVCSELRRQSPLLPILIVSAKDSPYDRVTGLTLGSDDYLVKPFLPMELVARVKALFRRIQAAAPAPSAQKTLSFGSLTLSKDQRVARVNQTPLALTPTEFEFLAYLMERNDRAVSREELLSALWQVNWQADTRATDDLVKRLRRKLSDASSTVRIETVWGFGFRLVEEGAGK